MILQATEDQITWLPRLQPAHLPYPLPNRIKVHVREEELGIEPQGIVGAIPLRNGDTLQITPKIGKVNFLRLLFKAEGLQPELCREYDDFVAYSLDEDQNIDSIVARQIFLSADEIMKRSPQFGSIRRRRLGLFVTGQIDATATALNLAQRKHEPVVCLVRERTLDIAENRVITEAIVRAWIMLNEVDRARFSPVYAKWMTRFPRSEDVQKDLWKVECGFAEHRYGGARGYYQKTLMLAQIILGSNGLGFSEATMVEGDAILLNTATIFEKYIRNIISEKYADAGYIVTKGGIGVPSLYVDGSFELIPDIIISRDKKILLIADAKYKLPSANDHYQMIAYLQAKGVRSGLLLAPLYDGQQVKIREYATANRFFVREAYLPINNLLEAEAFLGTLIDRFSL
jgi:hypothetical protein